MCFFAFQCGLESRLYLLTMWVSVHALRALFCACKSLLELLIVIIYRTFYYKMCKLVLSQTLFSKGLAVIVFDCTNIIFPVSVFIDSCYEVGLNKHC